MRRVDLIKKAAGRNGPPVIAAGLTRHSRLVSYHFPIGAISSVVERLLHTQEVAGSNPASRTVQVPPIFYTYVLRCGDGDLYVGSTRDLKRRIAQHRAGQVSATAHRLPVVLEYYEACRSEIGA